jgi:hypothetical protein
MHDLSAVVARVEKLEWENRRLKIVGGAVLLGLVAACTSAAVMPQEVPELIEARSFAVVDEDGTTRAGITSVGIGYHDERGNLRALLSPGGIAYIDENGTTRGRIEAGGSSYFDENGEIRARIVVGGSSYFDENGEIRARIVDDSFTYFDENGDVIWQAPQ